MNDEAFFDEPGRREAAFSHGNGSKVRELTLREEHFTGTRRCQDEDVADCGSIVDFWLGDIARQATLGARALPSA
jgi:hypothetical protein